jgi:hypothetical protein
MVYIPLGRHLRRAMRHERSIRATETLPADLSERIASTPRKLFLIYMEGNAPHF